jgi:hypothetical protein
VLWITLRTTSFYWEAELMQQILAAHNIPARVLDLGASPYMGGGSPAALQVRSQDQWAALLLLSPIEAETDEPNELL